jgi:DNA-binding NtrC family response regulator
VGSRTKLRNEFVTDRQAGERHGHVTGYFDINLKVVPTPAELWVLLVYHVEDPVRNVEQSLLDQGMRTLRVRNCAEARAALREPPPPAVLFTDAVLADGTWADVLKAASAVPRNIPVIVVSRVIDIPLYLDVLESGAYDFIVPPLASAELAHIVHGALLKVPNRTSAHPNKAGREIPFR